MGQNALPSNPDPLARMWEEERLTNTLYMLSIDLGHGNMADPDFLSIYVAIDTAGNQVLDVVLLVPVICTPQACQACRVVYCGSACRLWSR